MVSTMNSPPGSAQSSPPRGTSGPGGAFAGVPALAAALAVLAAVTAGAWLWPAPAASNPASNPASDRASNPASNGSLKAHVSGLSQVEVERADWRAQVCSGANAVGVGLRGEYFARTAWRGDPLLVRTDATLDFDSRLDWPADQTAAPRSVRWTGWVRAPLTGRYRFHAEPAGVAIEVAGQALAGPGVASEPPPIELAAGRFYPVTVAWDRVDAASGALRLQWTAPHGARFTIPRNALFMPTEAVGSVAARAASGSR